MRGEFSYLISYAHFEYKLLRFVKSFVKRILMGVEKSGMETLIYRVNCKFILRFDNIISFFVERTRYYKIVSNEFYFN